VRLRRGTDGRASLSRALTALTGAVVLAFAACGGSDTETASPAAGEPAAAPAAEGQAVTAELSEFAIALSGSDFEPGSYTFTVVNAGGVDHALEIEGPGGETETGLVPPGGSAELAVNLQNGAYELYCPVPGHREQGMELELVVGAGGGATEPPAATTRGGGYQGY
jgi:plastocyanin